MIDSDPRTPPEPADKTISRRDFLRGLGAVTLGLTLAGCGSPPPARPPSGTPFESEPKDSDEGSVDHRDALPFMEIREQIFTCQMDVLNNSFFYLEKYFDQLHAIVEGAQKYKESTDPSKGMNFLRLSSAVDPQFEYLLEFKNQETGLGSISNGVLLPENDDQGKVTYGGLVTNLLHVDTEIQNKEGSVVIPSDIPMSIIDALFEWHEATHVVLHIAFIESLLNTFGWKGLSEINRKRVCETLNSTAEHAFFKSTDDFRNNCGKVELVASIIGTIASLKQYVDDGYTISLNNYEGNDSQTWFVDIKKGDDCQNYSDSMQQVIGAGFVVEHDLLDVKGSLDEVVQSALSRFSSEALDGEKLSPWVDALQSSYRTNGNNFGDMAVHMPDSVDR